MELKMVRIVRPDLLIEEEWKNEIAVKMKELEDEGWKMITIPASLIDTLNPENTSIAIVFAKE